MPDRGFPCVICRERYLLSVCKRGKSGILYHVCSSGIYHCTGRCIAAEPETVISGKIKSHVAGSRR